MVGFTGPSAHPWDSRRTLQVAVAIFTCCLAATFDVCLFILLSAVSFHLTVLREQLDPPSGEPMSHLQLGQAWQVQADLAADQAAAVGSPARCRPAVVDAATTGPTGLHTDRPSLPSSPQHGDTRASPQRDKPAALGAVASRSDRDAPLSAGERLVAAEHHYRDIRRSVPSAEHDS